MKIKLSLSVLLLTFFQTVLLAQNTTDSPYTLYGYGELSDPSFSAQKAMGGIGYGLREANIINPLNPASFSRVDSMTFMLDIAITGQLSWFNDGINKSKNANAQLNYVAIQFPLYKNLGMGLGFKPISQVGYELGEIYADSVKTYLGSGGLSQFFGALSYNIKNLSVGINVGYLFGNVYHQEGISVGGSGYQYLQVDTLSTSGLILDFGIQYTQSLGKNRRIVLGAVYTPKLSVYGKYSGSKFTYYYNASGQRLVQTLEPLQPKDRGYEMPETYAVGFSYVNGDKFLGGIDYSYQKWSDAKYEGKVNRFNNRTKINIGGDFTPNARGRNYFGRMHYRFGGNYANSYISPVVKGNPYQFNEYSVSCGFGLPLVGGRSALNLAFEYVQVKPKEKVTGLIDEQYLKFTVSYTFNELWFFQRKVQ